MKRHHDRSATREKPGSKRILFVAPVAPPLNGQTTVTERLLRELRARGARVTLSNTAAALPADGYRGMANRIIRLLLAPWAICWARITGCRMAYISVLAYAGMYHTCLCAVLARMLGYKVFLHHHTYTHISSSSLPMRWICRLCATNCVHIVACQNMGDDLAATYPRIERTCCLSAVFLVNLAERPRKATRRGPLTLGYLGNITLEKGIDIAIQCFEQLDEKGDGVRLIVAGPISEESARDVVETARRTAPESIEYRDRIVGPQKEQFFEEIDVFLFPSRNDIQGIVNLEALAAGVPVIAYGHCCTVEDIGDRGGLSIALGEDYLAKAIPQLQYWLGNAEALEAASAAAQERFLALKEISASQLAALFREMNVAHDKVRRTSLSVGELVSTDKDVRRT